MYLKINKLYVILLFITLSSCYTSKEINYLQSDISQFVVPTQLTEYLVQENDILDIKVQSRDPEQSDFFNITALDNRGNDANPASMYLTGYSVNSDGMINLAIVGEVKVIGLSVKDIRKLVQSEIDKFLVNATVSVKITNFKVSVLGDVKNPGTQYIYNTQATIFEALSAAGDLNLSAKRTNVKLIRQKGANSIVVNLDLTDPAIIRSQYYFMFPNDVLYVDTSERNIADTNVKNNLGIFALILSAISTTVLVVSYISK
ncbi:polysaccharide biosynthesis/export family protein [Algibacter sp.]|uniref:polysaccharide biosynthesis/export family protein n=1 Tax=Algibacter sp. TaxID=1872428 RepID=UPI003C714CE8